MGGKLFSQIVGRELEPPVTPDIDALNWVPTKFTDSDQGELGEDDPLDIGCRIVAAFNSFDLNGDGKIDKEELTTVLGKFYSKGVTPEEVDQLMIAADTNKDGRIEYEEFVQWIFSDEDGEISRAIKDQERFLVH